MLVDARAVDLQLVVHQRTQPLQDCKCKGYLLMLLLLMLLLLMLLLLLLWLLLLLLLLLLRSKITQLLGYLPN